MAIGNLLTLLDDIAATLDDVSIMTKIAAKKTAGLLGDDLALNAEQVTGVAAERELPVVWAVTKGSFLNKLILVPAALLISYYIPWLITPLLMIGGAFLCFEGFEKVLHKITHPSASHDEKEAAVTAALKTPNATLESLENEKIKGAIRTDFILSAEIIVVALSTVADASFSEQIIVVGSIALLMTIGVYGLVAGIVKLDDVGLHLLKKRGTSIVNNTQRAVGQFLLSFAPFLMKTLTVLGTIAMFLVGGGIITHGLHGAHVFKEALVQYLTSMHHLLGIIAPFIADGLIGIILGAICFALIHFSTPIFSNFRKSSE